MKNETPIQAETSHTCDRCGCDLSYSSELHCAKCHRELWTSLPYKLGGTGDPHFVDHGEELSRTEATCDWYDHLIDEGRSDGYGESYGERQL